MLCFRRQPVDNIVCVFVALRAKQNVEFHMRRDRRGELRQGVYVCAKQGVRAGEELLISYGQGYWRTRLQGVSMEEFIYRRVGDPPCQPAAKRAKTAEKAPESTS